MSAAGDRKVCDAFFMNRRVLDSLFAYTLLAATLVSAPVSDAQAQRAAQVVIEPAALTTPDGKVIHFSSYAGDRCS